MQAISKNGITVEWPEETLPGNKYVIYWTALAYSGSKEQTTQFNIVLPGGTTKTITFTQSAGAISVS